MIFNLLTGWTNGFFLYGLFVLMINWLVHAFGRGKNRFVAWRGVHSLLWCVDEIPMCSIHRLISCKLIITTFRSDQVRRSGHLAVWCYRCPTSALKCWYLRGGRTINRIQKNFDPKTFFSDKTKDNDNSLVSTHHHADWSLIFSDNRVVQSYPWRSKFLCNLKLYAKSV